MRNYICDICGKDFEEEERLKLRNFMGMAQTLAKSSPDYIIQLLKYRLIGDMTMSDICFTCQCRIADVMGREISIMLHESQKEEKNKDA